MKYVEYPSKIDNFDYKLFKEEAHILDNYLSLGGLPYDFIQEAKIKFVEKGFNIYLHLYRDTNVKEYINYLQDYFKITTESLDHTFLPHLYLKYKNEEEKITQTEQSNS